MSMQQCLTMIALGLLMAVAGCVQTSPNGPPADARGAAFFRSPKEAVPIITKLLEAKDWPALARYYDLSGSGIERATLESGEFFWETKRPAAAHPAGFWRYKHPFAPGFKWHHEDPTDRPGVVKVTVMVEIDQGDGPPQRGFSQFKMKKHPQGWQILPERVTE